ncbi:MAG TPA: hypothetical protein DCM86_01750, partial [Verrucomicrobiales bacterium]|nr:hypothetical protein [Verrucomicrobiales bacterium]
MKEWTIRRRVGIGILLAAILFLGLGALVGHQVERLATRDLPAARPGVDLIQRTLLVGGAGGILLLGAIAAWILGGIRSQILTVARSLEEGATQFMNASQQVAASSQSLAAGATEQAAGLQETTASLAEMTGAVRRGAEVARETRQSAAETLASARSGLASNEGLTQALETIRLATGQMHGAVAGIQDASANVVKVVSTIEEIAFQTNLLALNAAVEAARAGESGMGFAIVAEEVRNLARRSAQAAQETAKLIAAAVDQAERGVSANGRVLDAVGSVTTAADTVARALNEIVSRVQAVDGRIGEIATSCASQATGITQVSSALTSVDQVTQANAASAEETAGASEELSGQARLLGRQVEVLFRIAGARGDRLPEGAAVAPRGPTPGLPTPPPPPGG